MKLSNSFFIPGEKNPASASHMTEWESSREYDEFNRAENLYRPVTGVMASRFTTAKYEDSHKSLDEEMVNLHAKKVCFYYLLVHEQKCFTLVKF